MSNDDGESPVRPVGATESDSDGTPLEGEKRSTVATAKEGRRVNRKSLIGFIVLLVFVLAAGHIMAYLMVEVLNTVSGRPGWALALGILFAVGTLGIFVYSADKLHSLRFTPQPSEKGSGSQQQLEASKRRAHVLEVLMAALALLSGHAFAIVMHHLLHAHHLLPNWAYGVALTVVVGGVIILHRLHRNLTVHRTLSEPVDADEYVKQGGKVEALILHVSSNAFTVDFNQGENKKEIWVSTQRASEPTVLLGDDPAQDVLRSTPGSKDPLCRWGEDEKYIKWNWQQLLRAIAPYKGQPLRYVYLLTSRKKTDKNGRTTYGSDGRGGDCQRLLEHYLPSVEFILKEGLDFESFDELSDVLTGEILPDLRRKDRGHKSIPPEHTVIDVTGGQKVTSAVGVVVTLNDHYQFQYVQTEGDCKPIIYNARTVPPPAEH